MKNKHNGLKFLAMAAVYALLVFLTMFIGFIHPYCWIYFPVLAAVAGAFPYVFGASYWRKSGLGIIFAIILSVFLYEGVVSSVFIMIGAGVISDILRHVLRKQSPKSLSIYIPYIILSLGVAGWLLPFWTRHEWYIDEAVKEMGESYAHTLSNLNGALPLMLLIILIIVAAIAGVSIARKCVTKSSSRSK